MPTRNISTFASETPDTLVSDTKPINMNEKFLTENLKEINALHRNKAVVIYDGRVVHVASESAQASKWAHDLLPEGTYLIHDCEYTPTKADEDWALVNRESLISMYYGMFLVIHNNAVAATFRTYDEAYDWSISHLPRGCGLIFLAERPLESNNKRF